MSAGSEPASSAVRPPEKSSSAWIAILLLIVAVGATYGHVLGHGFVHWDDDLHITENSALNPPRWSTVARFWTEPYEDLYIPLSYTLFAGEVVVADALFPRPIDQPPRAVVFKLTSLALHGWCVVLVWGLLRRWGGGDWGAVLGAALFAVHPVQVESVAWTSEQRGLLSATLGLWALWLHPMAADRAPGTRSAGRELAALVFFVAGLLAKPTLVVLAPIVLLIERAVSRESWKAAFFRALPWFCLAVVMTLVTQRIQSAARLPFQVALWERGPIVGDALAFHGWHLVWPWPLGIDYGRTPAVALESSWWWLGAGGLIAAAVVMLRAATPARLAMALFLTGLLPTLGLQPFAFQAISTVADRYAYLALLGPALGLAWLTKSLRMRGRLAVAVLGLLPLAVVAHRQVATWRTDETLFRHALAANPRSSIAWNNLGQALVRAGDESAAKTAFQRAIELSPHSPVALYNLGVLAERQGDEPTAGAYLQRAAIEPLARPQATMAWARWLVRHDRSAEALDWYRQTLEMDPRHIEALTESAGLLYRQGDAARAKQLLAAAIERGPFAWQPRVALGHILLGEGQTDRAARLYAEALQFRDDVPEALLNLGLLRIRDGLLNSAEQLLSRARTAAVQQHQADLATAATTELSSVLQQLGLDALDRRNAAAAVEFLRRACELDGDSAAAHFHLGRACLAQGDTAAAREALNRALALVPSDSEPARDIRSALEQAERTGR
jgi:Flp pilus assembly protein TadD